eukprot:NODE_3995_length_828_cov_99.810271_g3972_i0.p1 GENE.NODE_3995_length_828_cov_99.810271_g3972_i0~~NODE_3995_length_828_cov_99.810271_g3972_i0.p1  ORF type:complete len:222 (-),score=19.71 NODE_3995_length_828_cov_99.810271_g3972_i0:73-738(-)
MTLTPPNKHTHLVALAHVAEQCHRLEDAMVCCRKMIEQNSELDNGERDLALLVFKRLVNKKRQAFFAVDSAVGDSACGEAYRTRLLDDLVQYCSEVLNLLTTRLVPACQCSVTKVLFYSLTGDFCRYHVEATKAKDKVEQAEEAYTKALHVASAYLPCDHIARLRLALNASVFFAEVMDDGNKAIEIAAQAVANASESAHDSGAEAEPILKLLKDNLANWR